MIELMLMPSSGAFALAALICSLNQGKTTVNTFGSFFRCLHTAFRRLEIGHRKANFSVDSAQV
jgi:hypothetical protein